MPTETVDPIEHELAFAEAPTLWQFFNTDMDPLASERFTTRAEVECFVRGWNAHAEPEGEGEMIAVCKDSDGVYYHTPVVDAVRAKSIVTPAAPKTEEVGA